MKTITSPVPVTSTVIDELAVVNRRLRKLAKKMARATEAYYKAADEAAELEAKKLQLEHFAELESMVQYRDESHRSRRRHKKADRLCACQHRSNGLASLSDATHVKLTTKARHKARRDREQDKPVSQIRRARLRKQANRSEMIAVMYHLTPVEIAYFAKKAEETRRSKEGKRVKLLATLTDPAKISMLLNGDLHS